MTGPAAPMEPIDRATLELIVKAELGRMSVYVPTLATVNRARRVIMAAADAYRAWQPDADPPTPTQQIMASQRRAVLSLARLSTDPRTRPDRPTTERPSR